MSPEIADIIRDMEEQTRQHGGVPKLARETGQLLNLLIKATHARNILEVGTSDGYGTLWLAEAAIATDGHVTTIEQDIWRLEQAQDLFNRTPYAETIHVMNGDALELLPVLEGPFDFIVLDGDKAQALHYLRLVMDQTVSGAVICCDKAISKAPVLAEYLAYVHDRPGLESILMPVGEGIELTYKIP